ncbi:MAG: hypothetical protein IPK13_20455 [Deltaproteobacteria bacterium]|nr:hypothetical protein [Deltaproteobacteria bacterium]
MIVPWMFAGRGLVLSLSLFGQASTFDPVDGARPQPAPLAPAKPAAEKTPQPSPGPGMPDYMTMDCDSAQFFGGTRMEQAAFCYSELRRFVSTRTLAAEALKLNPRSVQANFLMGLALHQGEGNLPKSLFYLENAERLFVEHFGETPPRDVMSNIYHFVLRELVFVHGEMDQHEEKIAYIDLLSARLGLDYAPLKAWPLLKLKRFAEAREIAEAAVKSEDEWYRAVGLTALCAVESEMRHRQAAYEACIRAAEPVLNDGRYGAIELSNAGAAAEEMYRFDEAERFLLEATRRIPEGSVNPWGRLTRLYLREGRFAESVAAWREMRAYRQRRPSSYLDQQDQAESELTGAAVLIVAGRTHDARTLVERVVHRPDRQGTSSATSEQNEAGASVMSRLASLEVARSLEEEATWSPFLEAAWLRVRAAGLRFSGWMAGRRAADLLSEQGRLTATLRPECPGSMEGPSWLDGEVIEIVGPGVALGAIREARAEERLSAELAEPVFLALEAEAYLEMGDDVEALERAKRALEHLVKAEVLTRARVALVAANAAQTLGRYDEALGFFEMVLRTDPGLLRRRGTSLPVRFSALDDSEAVSNALTYLKRSPLLRDDGWGFGLSIGRGAVILSTPDGSEFLRIPVPPAELGDAEAEGRRIARALHRDLLVPNVDITQADIRSLDGSMGSGGKASVRVESVLDEVLHRP